MNHELRLKRIYEAESPEDGYRILVDRLWPRGLSKVRADLGEWDKEAAPDTLERKRLHDHEESFEEFAQSYRQQLEHNETAHQLITTIEDHLKDENVTLLYASKDQDHNNAQVLYQWILEHMNAPHPSQS